MTTPNLKQIKDAIGMLWPLFLISSLSHAFTCPLNFNTVDVGAALTDVLQQCGTPMQQTKSQKEPDVPQEWIYYISMSANAGGMTSPTTANGQTASIKMSIAFVSSKAINITVEQMSLASTGLCGNTVNVGDDKKTIEAACGKPTFVQKQATDAKPIEVIELKYDSPPPNTLIMENGFLTNIK